MSAFFARFLFPDVLSALPVWRAEGGEGRPGPDEWDAPFLFLTGVVSDSAAGLGGFAVLFPRLSSIAFERELVVLGLRLAVEGPEDE